MGEFIAAAALNPPTRNGYNAQGANFAFLIAAAALKHPTRTNI